MKKRSIGIDEVMVAIRAHCLECSGGSRNDVERCPIKTCNLYPYRSINAIGCKEDSNKPVKGQISLFDAMKNEGDKNGKGKRSRHSRTDKRPSDDG